MFFATVRAIVPRPLFCVVIDGRYDEGDVALPASKQNQCWSVPQATFTTRMSETSKPLLRKN